MSLVSLVSLLQRPTVWIDWAEARSTMLGWAGYKILLAERTDSFALKQQPAQAAGPL